MLMSHTILLLGYFRSWYWQMFLLRRHNITSITERMQFERPPCHRKASMGRVCPWLSMISPSCIIVEYKLFIITIQLSMCFFKWMVDFPRQRIWPSVLYTVIVVPYSPFNKIVKLINQCVIESVQRIERIRRDGRLWPCLFWIYLKSSPHKTVVGLLYVL